MEVFKKAKAFINGMYRQAIRKAEISNPEVLIADAEGRIEKSKKLAARQLIEIQTLAEAIRLEMKDKEHTLIEIQDDIRIAAEAKNKTLLVELFMEEEVAENAYLEQKKLYDSAVRDAVAIRDNYRSFEAEMNGKLQELKTMRTQTQLIKAREQILSIDSRYSSSESVRESMDKLRRTINERCARACSEEMLASSDPAAKIDIIKRNSSAKRALEKAEALLLITDSEATQSRDTVFQAENC